MSEPTGQEQEHREGPRDGEAPGDRMDAGAGEERAAVEEPGHDEAQGYEDSVRAAAELLGDRWTFLILRESFFGTRRFNEFAQNLGLSRNILSSRLRTLVSKGILEQRPYGPSETRTEYHLAASGRDIFPIVIALLQWGDEHLAGNRGRSIVLRHTRCGHDADPRFVCRACGEPLEVSELLPTPGPGASEWVRRRLGQAAEDAGSSQPD